MVEHGGIDLRQIAVARLPLFDHRGDHIRRWIVGDEVGHEFAADMLRRFRSACQIVQHDETVIRRSGVATVVDAEHLDLSRFCHAGAKHHLVMIVHGHARQHQRRRAHIGLRITAARAHGVQLDQLAPEIFIQTLLPICRRCRLRASRLRLIEIDQHGRMQNRCLQQIAKRSRKMRANGFDLVERRDHSHREGFVRIDGEMVEPEGGQPLVKPIG